MFYGRPPLRWATPLPLLIAPLVMTTGAFASPATPRNGQVHVSSPLAFRACTTGTHTPTFVALTRRGSVRVSASGAAFSFANAKDPGGLALRLVGGRPNAITEPVGRLAGVVNDYHGSDPSRWITAATTYSQVRAKDVYPGISVAYYGQHGSLEYDLIVSPGADPSVIRLGVEGGSGLAVDRDGDLVIGSLGGQMLLRRPYAYQALAGRRMEVACSYTLASDHTVRFAIGQYDHSRPLVVDPVVDWASYLGGSDFDTPYAVAATADGFVVVGATRSSGFPVAGAIQPTKGGDLDVFVSRFSSDGRTLIFSTYLGGMLGDEAHGIAVAANGDLCIAGSTRSSDFPVMSPCFQSVLRTGPDAFVVRLSGLGQYLAGTYLGGPAADTANAIAVDAAGSVYVAGVAGGPGFPTTPGAFRTSAGGGDDAIVAKLDPSLNQLVYSTYLPGAGTDQATGIAVNSAGQAFVGGLTTSSNYPTTAGAYMPTYPGESGFVTKLAADGASVVYSTFLGGGGGVTTLAGLAIDGAGCVYVAGNSSSAGFPTTPGSFQTVKGYGQDGVVAKLAADGASLKFSTFWGGNRTDNLVGVCVDAAGHATVIGDSTSDTIPAPGSESGGTEGFSKIHLMQLARDGSTAVAHEKLASLGVDAGRAVATDEMGHYYSVGESFGGSFTSVTAGAFQTSRPGDRDGVMFRHTLQQPCALTVSAPARARGAYVTITGTLTHAATGQPLASRRVSFTYRGVSVGSVSTGPDGVASVRYLVPAGTAVGQASIGAEFGGDDQYLPAQATGTAVVNAAGPLAMYAVNITTGKPGPIDPYSYLYAPGNPRTMISGKAISIVIDGSIVGTDTTDDHGFAHKRTRITPGMSSGSHTLEYTFDGDETYPAFTAARTLTVLDGNALGIYVARRAGSRGVAVPLYAYVYDLDTGELVQGAALTFAVDGVVVGSATSDRTGYARVVYTVPADALLGSHPVVVSHSFDGSYCEASRSAPLVVESKDHTAMYCRGYSALAGSPVKLYAYLWRANSGEMIGGKTIRFTVGGALVGTAVTDASGYAGIAYTMPASSAVVTAEFAGDDGGFASSASAALTVP